MGKSIIFGLVIVALLGLVVSDFCRNIVVSGYDSDLSVEGDSIIINKNGTTYHVVELFNEKILVSPVNGALDIQKVSWFNPRFPYVYVVSAISEPRLIKSHEGLLPAERANVPEMQAIAKRVWDKLVTPNAQPEKNPDWLVIKKI